jgi:hypothetical protein
VAHAQTLGRGAVAAMTVPAVLTALAAGVGLLAAWPASPLGWVRLIVEP